MAVAGTGSGKVPLCNLYIHAPKDPSIPYLLGCT